ncbi:MAG: hypothetical protein P4M00_25455 [Azospirillaceae bacterium]|nr:hypothetical protein [Azospirillaceae bacterium]
MALAIQTFSNTVGGNVLYKALAHPLAADAARSLIAAVAAGGTVAIFDPDGSFAGFAALYDLSGWTITARYVQRIEHLDQSRPECRLVDELISSPAPQLFVAAFDAERRIAPLRHLLPDGVVVTGYDALRLPDVLLSRPAAYLDPLNFSTNFVLFRDAAGLHTRIASANYWHHHGAPETALWACLFDADGTEQVRWTEPLPRAAAGFVIDSAEIRRRFGLEPFVGSLFIHVVGAAGHDVLKYAIDTYQDGADAWGDLSASHDANPWPADYYAGLPAPQPGEQVTLWIQNAHSMAIPPDVIGVAPIGEPAAVQTWPQAIPGFGCAAIDIATLFPATSWPTQFEIVAGRHFVRPRYEIRSAGGHRRLAHANVERDDLVADPRLPTLIGGALGRGYLLPASILPLDDWKTVALPTPMARDQRQLPLQIGIFDASGQPVLRVALGCRDRGDQRPVDIDSLLAERGLSLPSGYGHLELAYDFTEGGDGDGWLHGLFRYQRRTTEHAAETSFGSHLYNLPIVYRDEPQSYRGSPPGLTTRLFLRLGPAGTDTLCHLIYPASADWHPLSSTELILFGGNGAVIETKRLAIPCNGSRLWRVSALFEAGALTAAGPQGHVIVRDTTCRLFGYHGLTGSRGAFSFDHMFGF